MKYYCELTIAIGGRNISHEIIRPFFIASRGAMSGWYIVRTYIRRNRATYLIGISLTATASLLAVLVPWLLGRFADRFSKGTLSDVEVVRELVSMGINMTATGLSMLEEAAA